jgi:hypothetical protein
VPERLLGLERLAQHDADHEALGPVVEVVDVDHGDLVGVEVDRVALDGHVGRGSGARGGDRPEQAADERVDRAPPMARPAQSATVGVVVEAVVDELDQLAEAGDGPGPR